LPIDNVADDETLRRFEDSINRVRRVVTSDNLGDWHQWVEQYVEAIAWHVMREEDEFEDEFVLWMLECYNLSILFRSVYDMEEFIYIVMDLGEEGNRLVQLMRNMLRFFRRREWTIGEQIEDAIH
jgi:hypothetical protein